MARDFVPLYRNTHGEAEQRGELSLWEESFRENVACARAIEKALRGEYQKTGPIPPNCAAQVLTDYGFKRVNFVLQSTVLDLKDVNAVLRLLDEDTIKWANASGISPDKVYGHYYCVDTATGLLTEGWEEGIAKPLSIRRRKRIRRSVCSITPTVQPECTTKTSAARCWS